MEHNNTSDHGPVLAFFVKIKQTKNTTKKFSETDITTMLEFILDKMCPLFGGRVLSINSRLSYGYQLWSISYRLVPLLVRDRLHVWVSQ